MHCCLQRCLPPQSISQSRPALPMVKQSQAINTWLLIIVTEPHKQMWTYIPPHKLRLLTARLLILIMNHTKRVRTPIQAEASHNSIRIHKVCALPVRPNEYALVCLCIVFEKVVESFIAAVNMLQLIFTMYISADLLKMCTRH